MKTLLPLLLLAATPAFAGPAVPAVPAICPQAGEQLTEYLASARQRIGFDGEVRVEFNVDAAGRPQLVALSGSRVYQAPVRSAVQTLDCQRGTPQRYVLNIRFADRVPPAVAVAASAALAQSDLASSTLPH